jgi:predicted Zn finger-like uncharacterized protein
MFGPTQMLLTCPSCETIFRVDSQNLNVDGQTVRCSVCSRVWFAIPPKSDAKPKKTQRAKRGGSSKGFSAFIIILLLLMALAGGLVHQRVIVTAYLPSLVPGFDLMGMTIRSNTDGLAVVDLKAAYTGDTLRLGGSLQNNNAYDAHAADLLVTVTADDGKILKEKTITPDDRIIEAGGSTLFFVQLSIEKSDEAAVTVVPISKRITR